MRYAIFSALFAPHTGGVETFTANLARTLAGHGDEVSVVTSRIDASPLQEVRDGYEVVRLPSHPLLSGRFPLPCHDGTYRTQMAGLPKDDVDRVIVNCRFYPHSIEGLAFAASQKAPAIIIEHGSAPLTLGNPVADLALHIWESRYTRLAKSYHVPFHAISAQSARWLESIGIEPQGVIPNAIDAQAYRDLASSRDFRDELGAGDRPLVAFVGRLVAEKGARALVETAARDEMSDIVFALAGEGALQMQLAQMDVPNVHLLGNLAPPDVSALLQQADMLCLPSRSEGFCTALLEAGACGCTPVATHVGGTDELIGGDGGIILADAHPETIAHAIRELADDREHRMAFSRTVTERAAGFSWEHTADIVRNCW